MAQKRDEEQRADGLGTRIAARFREIGLTQEEVDMIEELREGHPVRSVEFD